MNDTQFWWLEFLRFDNRYTHMYYRVLSFGLYLILCMASVTTITSDLISVSDLFSHYMTILFVLSS